MAPPHIKILQALLVTAWFQNLKRCCDVGVAHTWPHSFLQTITKQAKGTPEAHGFHTQNAFNQLELKGPGSVQAQPHSPATISHKLFQQHSENWMDNRSTVANNIFGGFYCFPGNA